MKRSNHPAGRDTDAIMILTTAQLVKWNILGNVSLSEMNTTVVLSMELEPGVLQEMRNS